MALTREEIQNYTDILRDELVPAMGCTEPIAIAYAAAKACIFLPSTFPIIIPLILLVSSIFYDSGEKIVFDSVIFYKISEITKISAQIPQQCLRIPLRQIFNNHCVMLRVHRKPASSPLIPIEL